MKKKIVVHNAHQKHYVYELDAPAGRHFHPEFRPDLTPAEMLQLGVFDGDYLLDKEGVFPAEYPRAWFRKAKLSPGKPDSSLNFFRVRASQSLQVWRDKGWIHETDPRGWFEWYCRYYQGRRLPQEDERQIKRWKAVRRHAGQIIRHCRQGDLACRMRQRQALLHWAYDSRKW